jgi:hypothetical protein
MSRAGFAEDASTNAPAAPDGKQVYQNLRGIALSVAPADLGYKPELGSTTPYGMLMETGYPEATATLVLIADGTTSLYFSSGGGIVGGGRHEKVARCAAECVVFSKSAIGNMRKTESFPPPEQGRVRFYLLTASGVFTAEEDEVDLKSGKSPLAGLFLQAHQVIAELRKTAEGN